MKEALGERRVFLISVVGLIVVSVLAAEGMNLAGTPLGTGATPTTDVATTSTQAELVAAAEEPTATPIPTPSPSPTATPTPSPTPTPVQRHALDFQPMAVMIDNQEDARPHTGLIDADVVYEAVTEGGITRFMAVYTSRSVPVVGPVRSARHYFIYWASEYNAIYVHAGSSPQGYDAASAIGISRIDYTYGEGDFWRSSDREAPHNLYASIERLRRTISDNGNGSLGPLTFKHDDPEPRVAEIAITHPGGYHVSYTYDRTDNSYLRYMLGRAHVDVSNGMQYRAKNVIVQIMSTWLIPGDTAGRVDMGLIGSGPAYYFLDGKAKEGFWRKDAPTSPTLFLDERGDRLVFNAGQTWIQIVPSGGRVTFK